MQKRQDILFRQVIIACDIAALVLSFAAAYWLSGYVLQTWYGTLFPFTRYLWLLWIIIPTWLFLLHCFGCYGSASYDSFYENAATLLKVQVLGGLTLLAMLYLTKSEEVSRFLMQGFLGLSFMSLVGVRAGVRAALHHARKKRHPQRSKVIVIGTNSRAARYFRFVHERAHWGAEVVGFLTNTNRKNPEFCGRPVLGQLVDLPAVLQRQVVDEVVAVLPWREGIDIEGLTLTCVERGVTLRALVQMPATEVGKHNVEELERGVYLLSLETIPQDVLPLLIKRLLDIMGGAVGLVLCGLAYLWYRPKLRRESPGPVFFRQERVGQNGRLFALYKFRTMYLDAEERRKDLVADNEMEGFIFKMRNDPRVTPSGHRLRQRHLDELPQFWNVLKGDMSLVGTRPPTPDEVAQYQPHHCRRISMKCGLTGLWQLQGNGVINNFEDIVKLDCEYISNWSLRLDVQILAKTLVKVIKGGGW